MKELSFDEMENINGGNLTGPGISFGKFLHHLYNAATSSSHLTWIEKENVNRLS